MARQYSISASLNPAQRGQAVVNPRENSPTDWQYQMQRDPGFSAAFFPADQQSDNYRALNEGYQNVKNGMFGRLTGTEPIAGHMEFPRNILDQEQTNRPVWDIQKQTQIQSTHNAARTMFRIPSQYPFYRGRRVYQNFTGSAAFLNRG